PGLCFSDFRESSVVTKFFTVDDVTSDSTNHSPPLITLTNESEAQPAPAPPSHPQSSHATSCPQTSTSCGQKRSASGLRTSGLRTQTKTRSPDQTLKINTSPSGFLRPEDSFFLKTLSRTEKNRIQRDTDFMRCSQCLGLRVSDPAAVFCCLCGARLGPIPPAAPPPERTQMMSCVFCHSPVPVCSESCFVCDASLAPQLRPQSALHLSAPPLCACGAAGPAHSRCVLCDGGSGAPCGRCGAFTLSSAPFCSTCGFRAPPTDSPAANQAPPTSEQSTQTVGLYFPSATALRPKPNQNQDQNQNQNQDQNQNQTQRKPRPRGGVSPGRGFWRQQVDHVCAHLRSHAQNHAPFRTLLGEPRLGRLVSAVVHEDPHEVTLTLSFSSVTPVTPVTPVTCADRGAPAGGGLQTLSSLTEGLC
ncbi:double zinc ribbon and ankyrin repeat-containing protein 1, partial [Boleophthalmus pectinirostris]|uniref:double zinc ribbon and ankyrin repeat-containing protein 1 n=1 Tax=Boleophthalmus pectinirostris TaxID=150288 RepID=UPI00242A9F0E